MLAGFALLACAGSDTAPSADGAGPPDSESPSESASGEPGSGDSAESDLDADGDGVPDGEDCDPLDGSTYPGAPEICDRRDNDCDGVYDDACAAAPQGTIDLAAVALVFEGRDRPKYTAVGVSLGDIDGDGTVDLALTDHEYDQGADESECVRGGAIRSWALPLPSTLDAAGARTKLRHDDGHCLGQGVDLAGDADGDGLVDLVTSNHFRQARIFDPLAAEEVDDARATFDLSAMESSYPVWTQYARWVGDLDGDGTDEFAVTDLHYCIDEYYDNPYCPFARLLVLPGNATGNQGTESVLASIECTGKEDCGYRPVAPLSDVNGDGLGDFVHGGRHVFYGPVSGVLGVSDADFDLGDDGDTSRQHLFSASQAGDVDGDGLVDLAVAGEWDDRGGERMVGVVIMSAVTPGSHLVSEMPTRIEALRRNEVEECVYSTGAGDIDGDGVVDLVFGGSNGNHSEAQIAAVIEYGPFAGVREWGGQAVLVAPVGAGYGGMEHRIALGDVNADGFDDIAMGSMLTAPTEPLRAFLLYGGPR